MFVTKLKEKLSKLKTDAQEKVSEISSDLIASDSVREERLDICFNCDHLFKPTNSCKKCGCFVHAKTWLEKASCPVKKW